MNRFSRNIPAVRYWGPVALWMGIIYAASGDALSSDRTSRFIGPLVRWLFPEAGDEWIAAVHWLVRKGGHLMEYAILSILLWRALWQAGRGQLGPRSAAAWAFGGAALYAISDEVHQAFVGSRQGSVWDVLIDCCGAWLGLAAVRWRVKKHETDEPASDAGGGAPVSERDRGG